MSRTWIAVNLVLLMIVAFLGWQFRLVKDRFYAENNLARLQPATDLKDKMNMEGEIPPIPPPKVLSPAEFAVIPEKNLFSDTRAKEEKVEVPVAVEIPQLLQKPVLVGVTMSGSQRLAMIVDSAAAGTARKTQTRRIGDTYQGYTVTDITQNQMVLEYGPRREVIPLFDASKRPAGGGKTAIQATRIVAFGAGAAGAAPPGAVASPNAAAIAGAASRPPGTGNISPIGGSTSSAGAQRGVNRPSPQQGRATPAAPTQSAPSWNESTDSQGRRVIRTPFGDVVRPNPPNE
jgi:hypothetical protein